MFKLFHRKINKKVAEKPIEKLVTVADLFTKDDVNSEICDLNKVKSDITKIVIFYETSDKVIHFRNNNITYMECLGLIEYGKHILLSTDTDGEDDD
jgi:hypothetical protein